MNGMVDFLSAPTAQRVGWALVHFLWQGTAVALLLAVLLQLLRRRPPQARWAASCLALAAMAALPAVTACLVSVDRPVPATIAEMPTPPDAPEPAIAGMAPAPSSPPVADPTAVPMDSLSEPPDRAADTPSAGPWLRRAEDLLHPFLPWAVVAWLVGVTGMSLWHLGGWLQVRRLRHSGAGPADLAIRGAFGRLLQRLRVRRTVRLAESVRVAVPVVVGWLRPVILLPASALSGLSPAQLEAVLAHELAHIRRWDCLVRLLQAAVETLLFYHPAVWWVSRRIRAESEHCCDELAVEVCGDRKVYAEALAGMASMGNGIRGVAAAATGGKLLPRIRRIVGLAEGSSHGKASWLAGSVLMVGLAVTGLIVAGRQAVGQASTGNGKAEAAPTPPATQPGGEAGGLVFRGLHLAGAPRKTDQRDLPELFRESPPGSGTYEHVPGKQLAYAWLDGVVHYVPTQKLFYVQTGQSGKAKWPYYGPFYGDPYKRLGLSRIDQPTTQPARAAEKVAWGEVTRGLQSGIVLEGATRPRRIGETVTFSLWTRNVTDQPREFHVYDIRPRGWVALRAKDSNLINIGGLGWTGLVPVRVCLLRPKQTRQLWSTTWRLRPPDPGAPRRNMVLPVSPGKHRIFCVWSDSYLRTNRPVDVFFTGQIDLEVLPSRRAKTKDPSPVGQPAQQIPPSPKRPAATGAAPRGASTTRPSSPQAHPAAFSLMRVWIQKRLRHQFEAKGVFARAGHIYIGTRAPGGQIAKVNMATGRVVWSHPTQSTYQPSYPVSNGRVVIFATYYEPRFIIGLDERTGKELWKVPTGGQNMSAAAFAGDLAFIGSYDRHLYAIDWAKGTVRWKIPLGGRMWSRPAVVGKDVFVACYDGKLYHIDARTGAVRSRTAVGGRLCWDTVIAGGLAFLAAEEKDSNDLVVLDIAAGKAVARFPPEGQFSKHIVVDGDDVYFFDDSRLFAFDLKTRKLSWTFHTRGEVLPFPLVYRQVILLAMNRLGMEGQHANNTVALVRRTGKVLSRSNTGGVGAHEHDSAYVQHHDLLVRSSYGGTEAFRVSSDRPAATQPAGDLAWGDAVDGIRCAVRPAKPSFAPDEDIVADIVYRNLSDGPITVCTYPDPLYTWVRLDVITGDSMRVLSGQHGSGTRRPLAEGDFVTLQPGQTASFRQAIAHPAKPEYQLKPGDYYLKAEINKINRMDNHLPGLDVFRAQHGIGQVWCRGIESGKAPVTIAAPPGTQAAGEADLPPWGEPMHGLRMRATAPAGTTYRRGDGLPLVIAMRNVSDKPIPFPGLFRNVRIKAEDQKGKWLGIPRLPIDISPWEGRTGALAPGQIIRWTFDFERLRFVRPTPAGTAVTLRFSVPTQVEEPGQLPRSAYSNPVEVKLADAHPAPLAPAGIPAKWAKNMDLVYRWQPGGRPGSHGERAVHVDGAGRTTFVGVRRQKDPPVPSGRLEVRLGTQQLDELSQLLRAPELAKVKSEVHWPDEGEVRVSFRCGAAAWAGDFPAHVIAKHPSLQALHKYMQAIMAEATRASAPPAVRSRPRRDSPQVTQPAPSTGSGPSTQPADKPATGVSPGPPGGTGGNPRVSRTGSAVVLGNGATNADLATLRDAKGITSLRMGGEPVGAAGPLITDAGLVNIRGWRDLKILELMGSPLHKDQFPGRSAIPPHFTDEGLRHLAGLKKLERLVLIDQEITDAGLAHLSGLTELRELWLDFIPLRSDAGLKHLRGLRKLRVLRFHGARITDAGLAHLAGMTEMENLQLGRARITDSGLAIIGRMRKLHTLDLQGNAVTDKGLVQLAGLSALKWLCLNDTHVSDAGLTHLKGLGQLEWLFLSGTKVSDAGLAKLGGLKKLKRLNLKRTAVTEGGIRKLQLALPHVEVVADGGSRPAKAATPPAKRPADKPAKPLADKPAKGPADKPATQPVPSEAELKEQWDRLHFGQCRPVEPPARMTGDLAFGKMLPVLLAGAAGDKPAILRLAFVVFERTDDAITAKLYGQLISHPKAKWRVAMELVPPAGERLHKEVVVENSGVIARMPLLTSGHLTFRFDAARDLPAGSRFRVILARLDGDAPATGTFTTPDYKALVSRVKDRELPGSGTIAVEVPAMPERVPVQTRLWRQIEARPERDLTSLLSHGFELYWKSGRAEFRSAGLSGGSVPAEREFVTRDLPGGVYRVSMNSQPGRAGEAFLAGSTESVRLAERNARVRTRLEWFDAASLTVRLVDPNTSKPCPLVPVLGRLPNGLPIELRVDAQGTLRLRHLPEGRHTLEIGVRDWWSVLHPETIKTVSIDLRRAGRKTVTVGYSLDRPTYLCAGGAGAASSTGSGPSTRPADRPAPSTGAGPGTQPGAGVSKKARQLVDQLKADLKSFQLTLDGCVEMVAEGRGFLGKVKNRQKVSDTALHLDGPGAAVPRRLVAAKASFQVTEREAAEVIDTLARQRLFDEPEPFSPRLDEPYWALRVQGGPDASHTRSMPDPEAAKLLRALRTVVPKQATKTIDGHLRRVEGRMKARKPSTPPAPSTGSGPGTQPAGKAASGSQAGPTRLDVRMIEQPGEKLLKWLAGREQIANKGEAAAVAVLSDEEVKHALALAGAARRARGILPAGKSGVVDLTRTTMLPIPLRGGRGHHVTVSYRSGGIVNVKARAGGDRRKHSLDMQIEYVRFVAVSDGPKWEVVGKAACACAVPAGKTAAVVIALRDFTVALEGKSDPGTGLVSYTLRRTPAGDDLSRTKGAWRVVFLVTPAAAAKADGEGALPAGPMTLAAAKAPAAPASPLFSRSYAIADVIRAAREKKGVESEGALAAWLIEALAGNGLKREASFQLYHRWPLRGEPEGRCRIVATPAEHAQVVQALAKIRKHLGLRPPAVPAPRPIELEKKHFRVVLHDKDAARPGLWAIGLYQRSRLPPLPALYQRAAQGRIAEGCQELIGRLPGLHASDEQFVVDSFQRRDGRIAAHVKHVLSRQPDAPKTRAAYVWAPLPDLLPAGHYQVEIVFREHQRQGERLVATTKARTLRCEFDCRASGSAVLRALAEKAIALKPRAGRIGRSGQNPTGLDLTTMLRLTGQQKDLDAFTKDHRFFERDVKKLAAERRVWALCGLLDHPNVDAKIIAARALAALAEPNAAPVLLAAAKQNNYFVQGSESATLHAIYRRTLALALETARGQPLAFGEPGQVIRPEPGKPWLLIPKELTWRGSEGVDFQRVEAWLAEEYLPRPSSRPTTRSAPPGTQPAAADAGALSDADIGRLIVVAVRDRSMGGGPLPPPGMITTEGGRTLIRGLLQAVRPDEIVLKFPPPATHGVMTIPRENVLSIRLVQPATQPATQPARILEEMPPKPSFEKLTVAITSNWLWNRTITIKGDGTYTFDLQQLEKVPGEKHLQPSKERYVASYRLSAQHLAQLNRLLEATRWLTRPGALNRRIEDGTTYTLSAKRNNVTASAICCGKQPKEYEALIRFLLRLNRQEWLFYQLTDKAKYRSRPASEISSELDAALGKPGRAMPYAPVLDYLRFVPPFGAKLAAPAGQKADELITAAKLMGFLRIESQRRNLEALAADRKIDQTRVRAAAVKALTDLGGQQSLPVLLAIAQEPDCPVLGDVAEALAKGGGAKAIDVLKKMARRERRAAWALIRLGDAAVPAIVDVIDWPHEPNNSAAYHLIREYFEHWNELARPIDPRVLAAIRSKVELDAGGSTPAGDYGLKVLEAAGTPYRQRAPREAVAAFLDALSSGDARTIRKMILLYGRSQRSWGEIWRGLTRQAVAGKVKMVSTHVSRKSGYAWAVLADAEKAGKPPFLVILRVTGGKAWQFTSVSRFHANTLRWLRQKGPDAEALPETKLERALASRPPPTGERLRASLGALQAAFEQAARANPHPADKPPPPPGRGGSADQRTPGTPDRPAAPGPEPLARLWQDLASDDPGKAAGAVVALVAAGDEAVRFLASRLEPLGAELDPARIERLIRDLDDSKYAVRRKADEELVKCGPLAAPALREAVKHTTSNQVRSSLERLLSAGHRSHYDSPQLRRSGRAAMALEMIGTSLARQVLRRFGNPDRVAVAWQLATRAPVRSVAGREVAAAQKARSSGDRLRAQYVSSYRPGPHRNNETFLKAEQAYRDVIGRYPCTEIAAYCHSRLCGLYQYAGEYGAAIRQQQRKAVVFAGTIHQAEAYDSLGLTYLQAFHNPGRAMPWLTRAQALFHEVLPSPQQATSEVERAHRAALRLKWDTSVQQTLSRCRQELARRAEADKTPWANAVEGVQCRLRPVMQTSPAGKLPRLRADVQNTGSRALWRPDFNDVSEVQVDGRWFVAPKSRHDRPSWFGPACQRCNLRVVLAKYWRGKDDGEELKLMPGKHVVRVAFVASPPAGQGGEPVRALSNPVEIRVAPHAADAPAPAAASSRGAGTRSAKRPADKPATQPAGVGDVAGEFLTALRKKDLDKMKSLSLGSVTGWISKDQASKLRAKCPAGICADVLEDGVKVVHRKLHTVLTESMTHIGQQVIAANWAAASVPVPGETDHVIFVFKKTAQGWRFVYWNQAKGSLDENLARHADALEKILAAADQEANSTTGELHRYWQDLGSPDPKEAEIAVRAMAAMGDRAVAFLAGRFEPAPADAGRVKELVAKLGDAKYAVREQAYDELMRLGRAAVPALKEAMKDPKGSAEARQRVASVVSGWAKPPPDTPQGRRFEGAVQVLAEIGTPQAERILARLDGEGWHPWGQPVQGVQCWLRVDRQAWPPGRTPTLKACLRNRGKAVREVLPAQHAFEVEVDGRWYFCWPPAHDVPLRQVAPAAQCRDIEISLGKHWVDRQLWDASRGHRRLALSTGKHVVRVGFITGPSNANTRHQVRAVSNPVEIEMLPADPAPTGASPKGASTTRPSPARPAGGSAETQPTQAEALEAVRRAVEAFLKATAAGQDEEALRLCHRGNIPPKPGKRLLAKLRAMRGFEAVTIRRVLAARRAALAVTSLLVNKEGRQCVLLLRLSHDGRRWILYRIADGPWATAAMECKTFLKDYPEAKPGGLTAAERARLPDWRTVIPPGEKATPEQVFRSIRRIGRNGRYEVAIAKLESFARDHPGDDLAAEAHCEIAEILLRLRDRAGAIRKLEWVPANFPKARKPPAFPLSDGYNCMSREWRQYVDKHPILIKDYVWFRIGEIHWRGLGQLDKAVAAFEHILQTVPPDPLPKTKNAAIVATFRLHKEAMRLRANLLQNMGRTEDARLARAAYERTYPEQAWRRVGLQADAAGDHYQARDEAEGVAHRFMWAAREGGPDLMAPLIVEIPPG